MLPLFDDLAARLLRHGLPPADAARYAQELCDHREDLIAELMENGIDGEAAQKTADTRLGDIRTLARAAIRTHRRQSLMGRHAWFFFGVAPLFGVPFAIILPLMLALMCIVWLAGDLGKDHLHLAASTWLVIKCSSEAINYLWPGVIGVLLYRAAWKRGLTMSWRIATACVVMAWGAWLHCSTIIGDREHQGTFSVGMRLMPYIPQAIAAAACIGICAWCLDRHARKCPTQSEPVA